jgi:hypothetical protein
MKETQRRRITVTSSLTEISRDQLGKRVVVEEASGQIFKDDVNGFPSSRILASCLLRPAV